MAIEPFVRRRWPQILVSWTRLISGEWRDPLVGRAMFIGCVFGVLFCCVSFLYTFYLLPMIGQAGIEPPISIRFNALLGMRFLITCIMSFFAIGTFNGLLAICILFILKVIFKNLKVALVLFVIIQVMPYVFFNPWRAPLALIISILYIFLIVRFGLVTLVFAFFISVSLAELPINLQASVWYSDIGYMTLAIIAAFVLYAFHTYLGGRPVFGTPRLDSRGEPCVRP